MKLEVGQFIRTNDGYIHKIKKVNQFNVLVYGRDLFGEELNIPNNEIVKASYNIIDILEVGDYVNGSEVLGFENEYIEEDDKYVPFGIITENCYLDNNKSWIIEKDIKSIVTHEQMEQIAYKEVKKMNEYHMIIYFSDKVNFETYIDSQLDINEFTNKIREKFNTKDNIFINFIGDNIKYCVNRNNVLFYTIELTQKGITEVDE